jgi:PAS domain S-box-containing protein
MSSDSFRILDTNAAISKLTGYSQEELLGMRLPDLFPEAGRAAVAAQLAALATDGLRVSEAKCRRRDGSVVDLDVQQRRLEDGRILSVFRDPSQAVQAQGHLRRMLAGMELFAATVDADGKISYANPVLSALTGWSADELIGCSVYELLSAGAQGYGTVELGRRLRTASLKHPLITEIVTRSGENRLVAVSATPLEDSAGERSQAAILGHDVTEEHALRILMERELRQQRDVAAGIGRLDPGGTAATTAHAICRELRNLNEVDLAILFTFDADSDATVLAIDAPDNFFLSAGDHLPRARAGYLIQRARLGPWAERWQERSQDGLYGRAMTLAGAQSFSCAPIHYGSTPLGLLALGSLHGVGQGEVAAQLRAVTEFGAAATALLALDLQAERVASRRRLDLGKLIHAHAYSLLFQPIVEIADGRTRGYEALTRFLDGEHPDARLAAAWSIGVGSELELAMLSDAIEAGWQLPEGLWLNVNVSPRLLDDLGPVREILAQANRPLVLEITEHEVITDYPTFRAALSSLGPVRTAVDDTGSGIANFAHILELRPDFIKLDIGLIRGIDTDPAREAVVVAMCHFARDTGCRLIAEGVETRGEADAIRALGVDFGQGFWYGRPQAMEALIAGTSASAAKLGRDGAREPASKSPLGRRAQGGD